MLRRTMIVLSGVALAMSAVFVPAGAASRDDRPDQAPARAAADARTEHQRIVDFWTPARRASAIPVEVTGPQPTKGKPSGTPGSGGGGGGDTGDSSGAVTGATWTQVGDVSLTTGRVFFVSGPWLYSCSGSVVTGGLVLTAGHCVHDGDNGSFHTDWIFYPGYDNGPDPDLGEWTATDLFTTTAWATTADGFGDDFGLAVVEGPTPGVSLDAALAGTTIPTISFTYTDFSNVDYTSFGYPAEKKYKGETLIYCQGPVMESLDGASSLAMACDMNGGSSGGPWFRSFDNGATMEINSLNSYVYLSLKGYMFGPIFDGAEQAAYAGAGTGDCGEAPSGYVCIDYNP